jgi:hypothetical protein
MRDIAGELQLAGLGPQFMPLFDFADEFKLAEIMSAPPAGVVDRSKTPPQREFGPDTIPRPRHR